MNFTRIVVPVAGAVIVAFAWRTYGWPGIAIVAGAIVMWMLLHFTRLTQVLQRAANRPVGWVDSAVMLNARLRPGLTLLHVIGFARAIGEQMSPKGEEPEVFRWTDGSDSRVVCEFAGGKLARWSLERPDPSAPAAAAGEGASP